MQFHLLLDEKENSPESESITTHFMQSIFYSYSRNRLQKIAIQMHKTPTTNLIKINFSRKELIMKYLMTPLAALFAAKHF